MEDNQLIPLENMNIKVSMGPLLFDILLDDAFSTEFRPFNPMIIHTHPTYELHFIIRGSGTLFYEHTSVSFKAGDALLVAPGVYHRFAEHEDFYRSYMQFTYSVQKPIDELFPPTEANDILRIFPLIPGVALIPQADALFRLFRMIDDELRNHSFGSYIKVQGLFMLLMVELLRDLSDMTHDQNQPRFPLKTKDDHRTRIIDLFFERMVSESLKIEDLAAELHLSVKQTYRVVERLYGKPFKQIARGSQIEWVKEQLVSSSLSIQQIADQLGYVELRHFSRQFAIATGSTPSEYRQRHQSRPGESSRKPHSNRPHR